MHYFRRAARKHEEFPKDRVTAGLKAIRRIQLDVSAFNSSQKYLVFAAKISLTGCVTLAGFAAVHFFASRGLLALCNGIIAVQGFIVFTVLYDKGFSVPRSMAKLKNSLLWELKMSSSISRREKKRLGQEIRSVGTVAVLVGDFHRLQRISTPIFVVTSAKYAVRLLMIVRRYAV